MYTADGSPFAETLKEWHSDGTEFENLTPNPAIGSVCVGVWKQVSVRTVRLHHLGFLFTPDGAPDGTFATDETETLAVNGMSYAGKFTFRIYDVKGVFTGVGDHWDSCCDADHGELISDSATSRPPSYPVDGVKLLHSAAPPRRGEGIDFGHQLRRGWPERFSFRRPPCKRRAGGVSDTLSLSGSRCRKLGVAWLFDYLPTA
jgi:hypothetical protein